jgi:Ca2+/Na+ antiporter
MVASPYATAMLSLFCAVTTAQTVTTVEGALAAVVAAPEPDICQVGGSGYVFPLFGDDEAGWPKPVRGILYGIGTLWCFLGVAIVADLFMAAIEEITSKIYLKTDKMGKKRVHRFWNPTVANLSLMALGSSAPEIMLNVVEVVGLDFHVGPLGTSTIVGSAAFNLLVITACLVSAITDGTKKIEVMQVYMLTAAVSVFAYIWLLFIVVWSTPGIITLTEAVLTFVFFWILLLAAYLCDRKCFMTDKKQISPMSKTVADLSSHLPDQSSKGEAAPSGEGQLEGMSEAEQHKLAMGALDLQPATAATYRRNALALLTGKKAKTVHRKIKSMATMKSLTASLMGGADSDPKDEQLIRFHEESVEVLENAGTCNVCLTREGGDLETEVEVEVRSFDISATADKDYVALEGESVTFAKGALTAYITVTLLDDDKWEKNETFRIELENPTGGAKVDDKGKTCIVKIMNDDELKENASKLLQKLGNSDKMEVVMQAWKDQFTEALAIPVDEEDETAKPPKIAVFMHVLVVFWKVLFATVPPVRMGGGWPAFFVALIYIAAMTIGVSDLCGLFGCVLECPPAITAITFVALGTSMPDLFASKAAAVSDDNADNSIGNITGSNCVNVFLGLGLPWTIGAVYWSVASKEAIAKWVIKYSDTTHPAYADVQVFIKANPDSAAFVVPSGDLGLSVIVFCCCALTCIITLQGRRILFGGELGGPATPRLVTSVFFVMLWVLYVTVSGLKATEKIDFKM